MKDCIVIIGPTASGKTKLAISIAKEIDGEIISADSRQIYIGMDIGTAKPSKEERENIPHHLIDIITPDKYYSAKDFSDDAACIIQDISNRGKIPIITGGTGLYLKALFEGIFEHPDIPGEIRDRLNEELKEKGYSNVRQIAQEHSYVPDMWKVVSHPDVLVYLDVSYENSMRRRKQNWNYHDYQIQLGRLNNALNNADLYIDTNDLSVEQVLEKVIKYLRNK